MKILPHVDSPPCRIVFSDRGVQVGTGLEPEVVPDPTSIDLGPDGRFYTGSTTGGIGVWSGAGDPLFTIGSRGEGPGEMRVDAGLRIVPRVGPDGVLHVFTFSGLWYRFTRSGEFIDATRSRELVTPLLSAVTITEQGNVLTGQPAASPAQFEVIDPEGPTVLASQRLEYERGDAPFGLGFFQNTDVSWTTSRDSLGLQSFRVADYALIATADSSDRGTSLRAPCSGAPS